MLCRLSAGAPQPAVPGLIGLQGAARLMHVPLNFGFNLCTASQVSRFPGMVCSNPSRINLSAPAVLFFSCLRTGCFAQMFMIPMFFAYRCCFPAPAR